MAWLLVLSGCKGRASDETPDGAPDWAPCSGNADCASGMCVIGAESFCTRECIDDCTCPAGTVCTPANDGLSVCAPGANSCAGVDDAGAQSLPDAGAAPDAGQPEPDAGPPGGGAGAPCTTDEDCGDVTSRGGTGDRPQVETVPQECWSEDETGFPDGLCTMTDCQTNYMRDPCPAGTGCIWLRAGGVCLPTCERQQDCRSGWTCRDDVDAEGPNHVAVCWFSCHLTGCADGLTCQPDGTCQEEVEPPGPLDGCTNWNVGWSCVDRSPNLCSCTCYDWPRAGAAPSISCELVAGNQVACTCTTGGEAGARQSDTIDFAAGGADCGQAETVFTDDFCGLVP